MGGEGGGYLPYTVIGQLVGWLVGWVGGWLGSLCGGGVIG